MTFNLEAHMNKFLKIISILCFAPLLLQNASAQKPPEPKNVPKVVVTIKPLYSLTLAIMQGVGKPTLLLEGASDPHHFSLAPSHGKLIKEADLIIWVGAMLEEFMVKPIAANKKRRVTLMSTQGLKILHRKDSHGCLLEEACVGKDKSDKKSDDDLYDDQYTAIDPHIWLDIDNAILMAQEISYHLSALDLKNAGTYQKNTKALVKKLEDLKLEIDEKAKPLAHFHFISFHDAYAYLEHRYKLKNSAAETIKGHEKPSLKAFSKIRSLIKERDIRCILVDPQHPSEVEQRLAKEFDMSMYEADPLGIEIETDSEHYFSLIRNLIQQLDDCRQKHGPKK